LKANLILALPHNIIKLIEFGDFFDVAPPFHLSSTDEIGIFKLLEIEKISYYHPEMGHLSLLRVSGEVFSDKQQLKKFIKECRVEKESGQRVLIEAMELYAYDPSVSELGGFWLPKGVAMREIVINLWRQALLKSDISEVVTPQLVKMKGKNPISSSLEVE